MCFQSVYPIHLPILNFTDGSNQDTSSLCYTLPKQINLLYIVQIPPWSAETISFWPDMTAHVLSGQWPLTQGLS